MKNTLRKNQSWKKQSWKNQQKSRCLTVLLVTLAILTGCASEPKTTSIAATTQENPTAAIQLTDDDGRKIALDQPCQKIISLYSAHTENLYTLGVGERIIGVQDTSIYPPDAALKTVYDYEADPEKVIAAEPDLVLIRPFISRNAPNFVAALEKAGIPVVSLYPESLADFDGYIQKLALLTGTEAVAQEKLQDFHQRLDDLAARTKTVSVPQKVFFEATEVDLRTTTENSMAGQAITLAGGENVAKGVAPLKEGSTIANFGTEKVLALADEIDVYVSQRGAMNAGGNSHSIAIRPGFDTIKAVRDGRIFVINEKLISAPTFRYDQGVQEMARFMYPALMDDLRAYENDQPATKTDLANIIVKSRHLPIYVTPSSKYYQQTRQGHTYGLFADVPWNSADFNAIETAVQAGYVTWDKGADQQEYFQPQQMVTREELAQAVFVIGDFVPQKQHQAIKDLADCRHQAIVQNLVDHGVFALSQGKFEPNKVVTQAEIVTALAQIK